MTIKEMMETVIYLEEFKMELVKEGKFPDAGAIRSAIKAIRELIKITEDKKDGEVKNL